MRILHIVGGPIQGGAARGALWLHRGLRAIGVESELLVQKGPPTLELKSFETSKYLRLKQLFLGEFDSALPRIYPSRKREIFSSALLGNDLLSLDIYRRADIIHLHWINGGALSIRTIGKIKKPIVWTLRDMWPFTGGCHIYSDCDRFRMACGGCPQLHSRPSFDLSRLVHWLKRRNFHDNIHPVAISQWMADLAASSSLFSTLDVRTIPNCVDTDAFHPFDKTVAKQFLGLPSDRTIVLAGATDATEPHKGFAHLLEVAKRLDRDRYYFMFFGKSPAGSLPPDFPPAKYLGVLADDISLSIAYSSADIFLAPYLCDAFGKTLVEAMACQTPVVCFDHAGPAEIVVHAVTGYKAKPFVAADFATGTDWLATHPHLHDIGIAARNHAQKHFGIDSSARAYAALYASFL